MRPWFGVQESPGPAVEVQLKLNDQPATLNRHRRVPDPGVVKQYGHDALCRGYLLRRQIPGNGNLNFRSLHRWTWVLLCRSR